MGDDTILVNGRIATPDRVIEAGCVVLSGDRIAHVGKESPRDAPSADRPTVDVGGRIVMPGLIDLHGDDLEHQLVSSRRRVRRRGDGGRGVGSIQRV